MPFTIIPETGLMPLESVKLGRLIVNLRHPLDGYHDTDEPVPSIQPKQFFFSNDQDSQKDRSFSADFTSLLSAGISKRIGSSCEVAYTAGKTYLMDNSDEFIERVCANERSRQWLERTAKRYKKVHMIVSFQTIFDAHITLQTSQAKALHTKAVVPVNMALAANGVVLPFGDLINPGLSAGGYESCKNSSVLKAPGEYVCSLHYRTVKYRWRASLLRRDLMWANTAMSIRKEDYLRHAQINSGKKSVKVMVRNEQETCFPMSSDDIQHYLSMDDALEFCCSADLSEDPLDSFDFDAFLADPTDGSMDRFQVNQFRLQNAVEASSAFDEMSITSTTSGEADDSLYEVNSDLDDEELAAEWTKQDLGDGKIYMIN